MREMYNKNGNSKEIEGTGMIRNVVFDMGNVLINFNQGHFIDRAGVTDPADKELLLRELFHSIEWSLMDWGKMTEPEAEAAILPRLPERLHKVAHDMIFRWNEPVEPIPGMAKLIADCKAKGMGIYLLSNASERLYTYFDTIPGHELFEGRVVSATEKCVKPMPEIYQALLDRYHLKAEECLFVDDIAINVTGAMNCGLQGHVFDGDADRLRRRLGM